MFNPFKALGDLQALQKLAKDENFVKLLGHPKMKAMMEDPEVKEAVTSKNWLKLMSNPKVSMTMRDPEIVELVQKMQSKS